ncbi:MAG: DNA polymerase III subunit gamma/tau [Nitrospirae bacterium]|nr:DNA polymerase III subunit gamma/tau [Nitrospirota bacterium]
MAYQVLARRWRPSRLEEVVGQEHVVRALRGALASQRMPHALLFCGPRGVGKTTLARLVAKSLNCAKGPTPEPCLKCGPCTEIPTGMCVDVLEIDGASHTSVDEVRQIIEAVPYAPSSCRFKVYVIDEVHMLSLSAFNALLKTLEEPPAHVVFIFATTDPRRIPPTVIGRCQRFDFLRISHEAIVEKLGRMVAADGLPLSEAALHAIARFSEGSLRDAEVLLDQLLNAAGVRGRDAKGKPEKGDSAPITAEQVAEFLGRPSSDGLWTILNRLIERDGAGALQAFHRLYEGGCDPAIAVRALLNEVHALLVCRMTGEQAARILRRTADDMTPLTQRAQTSSDADLIQTSETLIQACELAEQSADPYVVVTTYLAKIAMLPRLMDVGPILKKLDTIAAGGATGFGMAGVSNPPPGHVSPPVPPMGGRGGGLAPVEEKGRAAGGAVLGSSDRAVDTGSAHPPGSVATSAAAGSFAEFVHQRSPMVGSFLRQVSIGREGSRLVLRPSSSDTGALHFLEDKIADLRAWAADHYGEPLEVALETEPGAGGHPGGASNIETHPMYGEFVRVFQPDRE